MTPPLIVLLSSDAYIITVSHSDIGLELQHTAGGLGIQHVGGVQHGVKSIIHTSRWDKCVLRKYSFTTNLGKATLLGTLPIQQHDWSRFKGD